MNKYRTENRIASVDTTDDTLTGRAGLLLFVRYLSQLNLYPLLEHHFGDLRKSRKGLPIWQLFLQVFCFFLDGTSRHLCYFDQLADDAGYAATIECPRKTMASSHAIKRFFKSFPWVAGNVFRKILHTLFVWRLQLEQPTEIEVTIDTMVMDNDEAPKRHGVQPTYKKVKGFQPLQMIWNGKIVDAVFRGGKKHSNSGNTVITMIERMVPIMRKACGETVFIVFRFDSGFFDEKIIDICNKLEVAFIMTGKMYPTVKEYVASQADEAWSTYDNGHQTWEFIEFGWGCDSWRHLYRTFYTRAVYDGKQRLLEFARPDNVVITNLGVVPGVLKHCSTSQRDRWLKPETIIASHHGRGADELPHRGLKDFGFEELPFKRFPANSAFYYCMVIAFFLHETFKEDVLDEVVPVTSYATRVRRTVIDIAAKIIKTGGQFILKVSKPVMESLRFDRLWERCQSPPPLRCAVY